MRWQSLWGRMVLAVLLLAGVVVGAAGCGTTSEAPPNAFDLNPYEIEFTVDPAIPAAGKPAQLGAKITGKQPLTKRAQISFEIKKVGADPREEISAARKDEGLYSASYTFKEAAKYSVTVHVITRSVHQVSNKEIEVK